MEIKKYLYLEHDGKILLVDNYGEGPMIPKMGRIEYENNNGLLRLPTIEEVQEMEIEWKYLRTNNLIFEEKKYNVTIGEPNISWPENWAWKDDVISDNNVDPLVRECVYRTIHRIVSKVIIINEKKQILMAKVSRGFFKGFWTLPGGFVNYGEHPRKGAEREVLEELGIKIKIADNNGESGNIIQGDDSSFIQHEIFNEEGISWVSFTYKYKIDMKDIDFKLKEDEIEEVIWFEYNTAIKNAVSVFDTNAIKSLIIKN